MGNYATVANLESRIDSDDVDRFAGTDQTGANSDTVLNEVIDYAEGQVNSYLASLYAVPVDTSGDTTLAAMLRNVALDLAQWHLVRRLEIVTEIQQLAYDKSLEWLKAVSEGELQLPSAAQVAQTTTRGGGVFWGTAGTTTTSKRKFTRATQGSI